MFPPRSMSLAIKFFRGNPFINKVERIHVLYVYCVWRATQLIVLLDAEKRKKEDKAMFQCLSFLWRAHSGMAFRIRVHRHGLCIELISKIIVMFHV